MEQDGTPITDDMADMVRFHHRIQLLRKEYPERLRQFLDDAIDIYDEYRTSHQAEWRYDPKLAMDAAFEGVMVLVDSIVELNDEIGSASGEINIDSEVDTSSLFDFDVSAEDDDDTPY